MGKNKRRKKQNEADFKKVKLKVGKKLPMGTNETQTSFKSQRIVVPTQDLTKEGQLTNVKKQSLKDLLSHLNHYSATVRQDSLIGLRSLFQQHITVFHDNLSLVLSSIADKMTDTDSDVRHSLLLLLRYILPQLPPNQATPFLPLLVAHLSCAMTHIYEDIQLESLGFLALCLELFPKEITTNSVQLLDNFVGLISHHSGGTHSSKHSKGSTKIAVNPKGKLASPKSRLKILTQLLEFLKAAYNTETVKSSHSEFDLDLEKTSIHFNHAKPTYVPLFGESSKEPKLQLFSFQDQMVGLRVPGANPTQGSFGATSDAREFTQRIVPLLLEFWVECSPSQLSTSLPDNALSPVNLSIMNTIMNILKVLLHALVKNEDSDLQRNWFLSSYFKDFNIHFMRFFPFQDRLQSKSKGKSKPSEKIDNNTTLMLNISVCEVMSFFVGMPSDLSKQSTKFAWMKSVEAFIVETLELSPKVYKINAEQLKSLLIYVEKVLQERIGDSATKLLSSLYTMYQTSHLLSAVKIVLLKFFAVLLLQDNTLQVRAQAPVLWQSIMNQWIHTLPKLLVQLKSSNPEITTVVVKVLSRLLKQNAAAVDSEELQKQLTSFLDPVTGSFCKLTIQSQKSVIELLFSLHELDGNLLQTLALCCHHTRVPVAVVQYLLHILHYRSSASYRLLDKTPAVLLSSYLSFLFSVAIGSSKNELNNLETSNVEQLQNTYNLHPGKNLHDTNSAWQRHQEIVKSICMVYSQLQNPQDLLHVMEPALEKLLKETKTLPVSVADSVLKLYKCYIHLASTPNTFPHRSDTPSSSTSVIEIIAQLSFSCVLYSIKVDDACSLDSEILQCLYNDVIDVLVAQPFVLMKFLAILLARAVGVSNGHSTPLSVQKDVLQQTSHVFVDLKHQVTVITAKLLQSLSSSPHLHSDDLATLLVNGIMEKIRAGESQSSHMSDLEYQYSLFIVEVKRRAAEK